MNLGTCKQIEAISFSFRLPAIEVPGESYIATSINSDTTITRAALTQAIATFTFLKALLWLLVAVLVLGGVGKRC